MSWVEKRVILCADLDAFYSQVIESLDPELREKPVGIRQKYLLATCNYKAREFGVKKLMSIGEAKRLCPEIVIIDGSDLRPFREASASVLRVWESFGVTEVERKGFDEAFLDVTRLVEERMHSYNGSIEIKGHVFGEPEASTLRDYLAIGSQIAQEMRDKLLQQLGYRCCMGIATCKTAAKLAGEMNKPNQQTTLIPEAFPEFIALQKASTVQGIGRKSVRKLFVKLHQKFPDATSLANSEKDLTCGMLQKLEKAEIAQVLESSSASEFIYNVVRGIDESPVRPASSLKTISQEETTLPHPETWAEATHRLKVLCERIMELVEERYSESKELPLTVRVSVSDKINVNVKQHDGIHHRKDRRHQSKQTKAGPATFTSMEGLHRCAEPLLRGCLLPDQNFQLCRINLAVTNFQKTQFDLHGKQSSISEVFSRMNESKKRTASEPIPGSCDAGDIDFDVLNALPKDIRDEVLEDIRRKEQNRKQSKKGRTITSFFQQ